MRLRYIKRAAQQIDKALDYIAIRSPQGALHVRERLRAVESLLLSHPYAGHATSRAGTRRIFLTPYLYLVDYRVAEDEIIVIRFRHAAQLSPATP